MIRMDCTPPHNLDPKENTTSERTPKKIPPHCCYQETDRYQETDLELTKNKTPPLHSNSPPSPSNTHTKSARFAFIYIEKKKKVMMKCRIETGSKLRRYPVQAINIHTFTHSDSQLTKINT
jgi:hypothetical protein